MNNPNIIVGIKLEKHRTKKPKEIAIDVVKTALPTVVCESSIASRLLADLLLLNLYWYK